ncbi:glycoside hydrolase family 9 protein [Fibrobacter sp.]|uniref:glycoside hydrolase family 9 protein n=1 Tax=Fibrobacter sp. TaxID=35828 RepID=UPI003890654F
MPFFVVPILLFAAMAFAVEQEQPTPYDLVRPVWPTVWDTIPTDEGGTVESFSKFSGNPVRHNTVPPVSARPQDFKPNEIIPDSLNQAFRDARNLRIGRIRINQAGYLPDDPEMQFYYVSAGACEETYSVVDLNGNVIASNGKFRSSGKAAQSHWDIIGGTDAAVAQDKQWRYKTSADGPKGTVCIGNLTEVGDLPKNQRMRVSVGKQLSSTFIVSERVYSMVRDAILKFYGINRSGNSESWFHKPSHTKDGAGKFVAGKEASAVNGFTSKEGALQGGWYDCGDHLKESQTQAYAFLVLAVMAGSDPDRDDDNYAYNHGQTVVTDGIPDILREAKHGADFFLRSFAFANGVVDNMVVSVGNFGADHGWWGRPENQDALPATLTGRGGPHERDLRLGELGSNISSEIAAGLAILSKNYAEYDKPFADSCLMVAKKLYDFAKNLQLGNKTYDGGKQIVYNTVPAGWSSAAYNGNNEAYDDLAIAAVALHYATYEETKDMTYLNDAVEDKQIGSDPEASIGFFNGGWMQYTRDGMRKSSKNTSWANAYTYTLYGFYKLLLKDKETGARYGIDDNTRLKYAENVALILGTNLSYLGKTGGSSITIPTLNGPTPLSYGDLWYDMQTDQTWIYNRYQAGNIFEVFAYYEVTKDLEGVKLPQKGVQNWNAEAMKQLGINQLNYLLGVNPWDVSFLLGVGDKNDAHPHHRASNPEGKNMPGAAYNYTPPTGALFGGVTPDQDWTPSTMSWEDYHLSETCIDGTAMFLAAATVAIKEEDRNRAPSDISVEIRYAGYDSAIVVITQDIRGQAMILYSTNETGPFNIPVKDTVPAMQHEIHMTGLQNGTTYYFKVIAINSRSEAYATKWLVDSTSTPYSFTTLVSPQGPADIQHVKVCNLSADSAEIMWYTPNGQYESKIYWDTTLTSYDKMQWNTGDINADVSGIPTNFHYVKIGGLQEKTTYYYCVESNGVQRCQDDNNMPLKFTTPVTRYNFKVSVYQYEFGGMDFMNLNIVNNEERAFDNIELRIYVTARPEEIEPVPGENNQPGSCPLLMDSDICQAYDEAGFNNPCLNTQGQNVDDTIRYNLRHAVPQKLEDTYNSTTGTYDWYIPINLGGTLIKSSSRMRIDIGFSSGIYQNGGCETLRTPAVKRFTANSDDWSWKAHTREVDGADFDGVPSWDKDQGDIENAPENPYIAVYRKDEFISGFSPSYMEMANKKADYKMTVSLDPPFNLENNSYIQIDSTISTMHVKGTALITESGYVTDIWVNGVALSKDQLKTAAVYNSETGKYDLDIPAKMTIGTNKVDITIFAGPSPYCEECQENGGCAFVNRSYYVQFSKGDRTASAIQLLKEDGSSVMTPAATDGTLKFHVLVKDKDNRDNSSIKVKMYNTRTQDSTEITLNRTDEVLGYFESDLLHAIQEESVSLPNISFLGGDTVKFVYVDGDDEEDISIASFTAPPTHPVPQTALLKNNPCTSTDNTLAIAFSGSQFNGITLVLDSVSLQIDSTATTSSANIMLVPSGAIIGSEAIFELPDGSLPATAAPSGKVIVYMSEEGKATSSEVNITDGINPTLVSLTILENENHANVQDTLKVVFSEPVNLANKTTWPFAIMDGLNDIPQSSIVVKNVTTKDNKSWQYVIEGNTDGAFIKQGFTAKISADFSVYDNTSNLLTVCSPVTITESVRPVPVQYAKISDFEGDGQPDEIYIQFVKTLREKDMLDTIDVYWGNPSVYHAFPKPENGWTIDTLQGSKTARAVTRIDSTNGTWSIRSNKTCGTKDVTTYTYDTTFVKDSITGLATEVVDHIDSIPSTKTVEDKSNCTTVADSTFIPTVDTVGWDTIVNTVSVIRIPVTGGLYKNNTYGSKDGNGTVLPRQGPLGGFFDDNTATLFDNCPPVIVKASWIGYELSDGQIDNLMVTMSEPLDSITTHPYMIERRREGKTGVYVSSLLNPNTSMTHKTGDPTGYTFIYNHEDIDAPWIGDDVRLVPDTAMSYFKDAAGLFAGTETPWVPVVGIIKNVKIQISMQENITTGGVAGAYNGAKLGDDEMFRLTVKNKNEEDVLIAAGNHTLHPVTAQPVPGYIHGGPVFEIELTLPEVFDITASGEQKRDYKVKLDMGIFNNLGSVVNNVYYNFDVAPLKDYITASSTLTLYLEWCAPEGTPLSGEGKKIGSGPYIAKFDMSAKGYYNAQSPDDGDNLDTKYRNVTSTKTFGFRRAPQK